MKRLEDLIDNIDELIYYGDLNEFFKFNLYNKFKKLESFINPYFEFNLILNFKNDNIWFDISTALILYIR